jgi:hypothetical protein
MNLWSNFWDVVWWFLWIFVFVAYLMVLISIFSDLFRDRKLSGGWKAVWVIFLIFVPFLTALIYLIARGSGMAERGMAEAARAKEAQDAYIRQVSSSGASATDEIAKASELLKAGAITQAEFDALKARVLG